MADAEGRALCAWLSLFECAGGEIRSLSEIIDGAALIRIFGEISGISCDLDDTKGSRWLVLLPMIDEWYESQGLAQPYAAAGLMENEGEMDLEGCAATVKLLLCGAVQCRDKARYIGSIMSELREEEQATLMVIVEGSLSSSSQSPAGAPYSRPHAAMSEDYEDELEALRDECERLRDETARLRDELESHRLQAESAAAVLSRARDEQGGEMALAASREAESARLLEAARASLRACEIETEKLRREEQSTHDKLEVASEQLKRSEDIRARLEDEVDVLRAQDEELERVRAHVEKLKLKVDETNELRRELRELDAQNARHLEEIVRLEAEKKQAESRAADVTALKSELKAKSQACFELRSNLELCRTDLDRCREELEEAREARRFFEDEAAARRGSLETSNQDPSFPSLFDESAAQLREKVARLEREKAQLVATKTAPEATDALRGQLADRERDALEARKACAIAEAECTRLRAAAKLRSDDNAVKKTVTSPEMVSDGLVAQLGKRDAKIQKLEAERPKLEAHMRRTLQNIQDKYKVLIQTYKNQLREKQDKIEALESRLRNDRAAHKREEQLLMYTIYDVGQRIIDQDFAQLHGGLAVPPPESSPITPIERRYPSEISSPSPAPDS